MNRAVAISGVTGNTAHNHAQPLESAFDRENLKTSRLDDDRGIGTIAVLDRLQTYQPVDPSEYYASVSPSFDAPEGPHDWLCKTMFVGKVDRKADRAVFTYWSVG